MKDSTKNYIHDYINKDIAGGRTDRIHTRFIPPANVPLHIEHCKELAANFGTAEKYGGLCNLRIDDIAFNQTDIGFIDAIQEDIRWLGFDWGERFYYSSDSFERMYEFAEELIKNGDAYICELTPEDFMKCRGDLIHPMVSLYRDRSSEESLDLFCRMRAGEFPDGRYTLRAKIDLASDNFLLRDPVLYYIRDFEHTRQGRKWCIFPTDDFVRPIQDALEGITHSLCSLEYEAHRPLYNWVLEHCNIPDKPRQIELSRLHISNMVSDGHFRYLVERGIVDGWDDPRMPTLCGLRRRGYTPNAILNFIGRIGVTKSNNMADIRLLEHCIREELNMKAERRIAVLKPVKLIIDNYPEDRTEYFELPNNPNDENAGTRKVPFTREIYIDADDFAEVSPPRFFGLKPNCEVRLIASYIIKCVEIVHDENGNVTEIHCTADLETGIGNPVDRKIKGRIHWLSAKYAQDTTVVLYNRLFTEENMYALPEGKNYMDFLNPNSAVKLENVKIEPVLADAIPGERFQFIRIGYFIKDKESENTFNRIVSLKAVNAP